MGDYLSADAILAFDDTKIEDVDVPEWGGIIRLRSLSGAERDAFEASLRIRDGKNIIVSLENYRAKFVARSAIDPDTGARLFTDQQVHLLGQKNAAVLLRLYKVATALSGMEESGEDLAGNSEADPSGDSGSSSPAN